MTTLKSSVMYKNMPLCRILGEDMKSVLRNQPAKRIVLSGPSGFVGSRVLDYILQLHADRIAYKLPPGEVVLLSSAPGRLMLRLSGIYGANSMRTIRASRVDYYTQHDVNTWLDHLGSLSLGGENCVFVNLAGVAGPDKIRPDAMMDVNYRAPLAAAKACEVLGFGHWVQSSTQATKAERAGQVPYSRGNAMMDHALYRMNNLPVTIACLGLLYSEADGIVGQVGDKLNLVDLAMLPITPIMGDGRAPLQPQEVLDAAERIAFLALNDPSTRPIQKPLKAEHIGNLRGYTLRSYDAVGPEAMTFEDLLRKFAYYQGRDKFRPAYIDYRSMERVLNVASLGNLNRQFVSLLRSEQSAISPHLGNPSVWEKVIGDKGHLRTLDECFFNKRIKRAFPYRATANWIWENPRVIVPGIKLVAETVQSYFLGSHPDGAIKLTKKDQLQHEK